MPKHYVIIPCAGIGSRFASTLPKQYHRIAGKTLLEWTLAPFIQLEQIWRIVLVVGPNDRHIEGSFVPHPKVEIHKVGGASRAESVLNGLALLDCLNDDWILVHDAARCCVRCEDILKLINGLANFTSGGILAQKASDTIKQIDPQLRVVATLKRELIYQAQTPQMFRAAVLRSALDRADLESVTDESSTVEALGLPVQIIECGSHNFKVTHPQDLAFAELLLQANFKGN